MKEIYRSHHFIVDGLAPNHRIRQTESNSTPLKESKMWRQLKSDMQRLKNGQPGQRFRQFRKYKKSKNESMMASIAVWISGLSLIIFGLAISWLPGPGGFLAIIGLAILAPDIPGASYLLDYCELAIRQMWRWIKNPRG